MADGDVSMQQTLRIAAVGDVHLGADGRGALRPDFADLPRHADVFLVAGDLTRRGTAAEAEVVAAEFADLGLPVLAVLGNHDHHSDRAAEVTAILERAGIRVLDGTSEVIRIGDVRLAVAGVKGFGGGFSGAYGSQFGEPEMKAFVAHSRVQADRLDVALDVEADVHVVLTHYAPVPDTLAGERPELFPFLGSYLLEEVIDRHDVRLAVHGHAHFGSEVGLTAGGVPVRNVARAVIDRPYAIYSIGP